MTPAPAAAQVLIDFGLSYNTTLAEDKAVDLYVLERALTSAHSTFTGLVRSRRAMRERCCMSSAWLDGCLRMQFEAILEEYRRSSKQWSATLHKFAEGACSPHG